MRFAVVAPARVDRSDPYFYPYQRYVFSANATMRHVTSKTRITPALYRALLSRAAPTAWSVDGTGRLVVERQGEVGPEAAACEVLTREVIDPRSGVAAPPRHPPPPPRGDAHPPPQRPHPRRAPRPARGGGP